MFAGKNKGKKLLVVRFEVEVISLERLPLSCHADGLVVHWKRSSSNSKGTSEPILLYAPSTTFNPVVDMTKFIVDCRL